LIVFFGGPGRWSPLSHILVASAAPTRLIRKRRRGVHSYQQSRPNAETHRRSTAEPDSSVIHEDISIDPSPRTVTCTIVIDP